MVDESHDEGMLDESEYERLAGALGFTSRTVADVLLPLDAIETVDRGARASPTSRSSAPTPATRGSRWSATAASWSATCTSRTCSSPTPTAGRGWSRTSGSGPFATVRVADTLVTALQTLQAKGAHMARVVDDDGHGRRAWPPSRT